MAGMMTMEERKQAAAALKEKEDARRTEREIASRGRDYNYRGAVEKWREAVLARNEMLARHAQEKSAIHAKYLSDLAEFRLRSSTEILEATSAIVNAKQAMADEKAAIPRGKIGRPKLNA